jgi:hypothetical protein
MWDHVNVASLLVCFADVTSDDQRSIMQLLSHDPWLIVVGLALLIPIVGIIFGTISDYFRKTRLAEIEAALKRDMLDRGMTAEQIKMVLEASSHRHKNNHGNCG